MNIIDKMNDEIMLHRVFTPKREGEICFYLGWSERNELFKSSDPLIGTLDIANQTFCGYPFWIIATDHYFRIV